MAIAPFDLNKYKVSQKFGVKNSAYRLGFHPGTDFKMPVGVAIKAPEAGYASWHWSKTYGNVAALILKNGDVLWFAHNSRKGKTGNVNKGDVIAYSGNTGWTTGPHSHVEYRVKGDQDKVRDFEVWLRHNPEPQKHRYAGLVGKMIRLTPKNGRWRFYKRNTDKVAINIKDEGDLLYKVRGVSQRSNRVVVNSASGGGLVDVPLADAAGREYKGEWRVV